jgi:AcrR family transcriptional regulator
MARPLSDDKRTAILEAAAEVVAALGVSAPTAKIAKAAGVAEGTVFTYFATKDELLNQLYLAIKTELSDAVMAGYPAGGGVDRRCRHIWDRYIGWGSRHPLKRKAARQLAVSDRITGRSREVVAEAFRGFNALMRECVEGRALEGLTPEFASSLLGAVAETTIEFIAREPKRAGPYSEAGFQAFWKGVTG